jgi:hypothetical protein
MLVPAVAFWQTPLRQYLEIGVHGHVTSVQKQSFILEVAVKDTWYHIDLPMRYQSVAKGSAKGCGRTLAINSRTVRFASDQDLQVGLRVWLGISWPVRLPDGVVLSLWLLGPIERCSLREVEVTITRHEFRIRPAAQCEELGNVRVLASRAG